MTYRDFVRRLKAYGVREYPAHGKGSERLLVRETAPGSRKGPQYTIKCHGEGRDVATGTVHAALRRLGIDTTDFFAA